MPRDLMRQLLTDRIETHRTERIGETLTRFLLTPYDPQGTLMPTADIIISGTIVSAIPLAANNRNLLYVKPGTPVTMSRSATGRLEVTGLSKRGFSSVFTYKMDVPVITLESSNAGSAFTPASVVSGPTQGFSTRTVTLGELATVTTIGFGQTPLQAQLILNAAGGIIGVV